MVERHTHSFIRKPIGKAHKHLCARKSEKHDRAQRKLMRMKIRAYNVGAIPNGYEGKSQLKHLNV